MFGESVQLSPDHGFQRGSNLPITQVQCRALSEQRLMSSRFGSEVHMAIHFNHTILSAHDSKASATFLAEMLGLPAPRKWGPFHMVTTENDANLDYMDSKVK